MSPSHRSSEKLEPWVGTGHPTAAIQVQFLPTSTVSETKFGRNHHLPLAPTAELVPNYSVFSRDRTLSGAYYYRTEELPGEQR
jgi:hypothetical protein